MHLKVGCFPHLRINGELVPLGDQGKLDKEDSLMMAFSIMNNKQKERFRDQAEIDLGYGVRGLGRFRVNVFQQRGQVSAAIRAIPNEIQGFEELCLPGILEKIAQEPRGLVLVTGTTGSGKSTTIASMLNYINERTMRHIITIEDPIEFSYTDRMSIISQREIGVDAQSFAAALRSSLRQDPDVILVGEMRDMETIETALVAAETGHLVFSTLHTLDAVETINRITSVFPMHQQKQIRLQLSMVLRAVISMRLMRRSDAPGRVPAIEIMRATDLSAAAFWIRIKPVCYERRLPLEHLNTACRPLINLSTNTIKQAESPLKTRWVMPRIPRNLSFAFRESTPRKMPP